MNQKINEIDSLTQYQFECWLMKHYKFDDVIHMPAARLGLEVWAYLSSETDRLNEIINTPQADDFLRAVSIEAEHQRLYPVRAYGTFESLILRETSVKFNVI